MGVDTLEIRSLIGLYRKYQLALPLPMQQYFITRGNQELGPSVAWDVLEMGRGTAQSNTRDGDPHQVTPPARANVTASGIHFSESIYVPPTVLKDLRAPGEVEVNNGDIWVGDCINELRGRHERALELLRVQTMGMNSSNPGYLQIRRPGLSTDTTVDLGFDAGHLAVGSAWDTTTTDIISDIETAKLTAVQDSGVMPDTMWTTTTVMGYMRNNDAINAFMSDNSKDEMRLNGRIKRICELDIVLLDQQYDSDDAGNMTNYWPAGGVVIGPAQSANRRIIECSPVSVHAPDTARGFYAMTTYDARMKGGAWIEYEYTGLPIYTVPDELMSDVDVTA